MNYLKELKAFKDWMLLNDLPTSAIALWHTLMTINNMTGWKERFNAPNSTVEKLTGLSKQGLDNARRKLLENGLIEYEKGKKGKAPVYKIVSLVNSVDSYFDQSVDQSYDQIADQSVDQDLTIPKHKLNNTKTIDDNNERVNPFVFYESNFGVLNSFIGESISQWCNDLSDELVIEAMKRALKQQRKWNYAEGILKDWHLKNLKTIGDVEAADVEFANTKNRKTSNSKKPEQEYNYGF